MAVRTMAPLSTPTLSQHDTDVILSLLAYVLYIDVTCDVTDDVTGDDAGDVIGDDTDDVIEVLPFSLLILLTLLILLLSSSWTTLPLILSPFRCTFCDSIFLAVV